MSQPKLMPAVWRVTEWNAAKWYFVWVSRSPGARIVGGLWIEAAGPGSRATLTLDFAGLFAPLVRLLFGGLRERYVGLEANGLKARSEGRR